MRFVMTRLNNSAKFSLLPLTAIVSSILLTACGGSFSSPSYIEAGINPTVIPKVPENQPTPKPSDSTEQNSTPKVEPLFKPALNAVMPIPKRKKPLQLADKKYFNEHEPLTEEALKKNSQKTLADLEKELKENYDKKNKDYYQNNFSEDKSPYKKAHDNYQFVKTGWIFSYLYADDFLEKQNEEAKKYQIKDGDGYVYYYAEQPTIGRTKGSAKYTGSWDFVTDAKSDRRQNGEHADQSPLGGGTQFGVDRYWGDEMGATSFSEQSVEQYAPRQGNHQATFNANFDDKKLTGKLTSRKKETKNGDWKTTDRYTVDAKIQGNRFFGSAKAVDNKTTLQFFQKDATNRLEGGFFGPNAEELGGRFLTDDNSVFGVFSGKQDKDKVQQLETKYDGLYTDVSLNSEKATTQAIPNYGNVTQLQLGSTLIELLPTDYVKQDVTLSKGQKAIITSFGSADGAVRVGSINKTGETPNKKPKTPPKPEFSAEEIKKAKQKLNDAKEKHYHEVNDKLLELLDDDNQDKLKADIKKSILSAYSDTKKIGNEVDKLFKKLKFDGDDSDFEIIDKIARLVNAGEKYKLEIEANWQAHLPKRPIESLYSKQIIESAKSKFNQKINSDKKELIELIDDYIVLSEDGEKDEKQESKQEIIKKVLEAYSPNQHNAIKTKIEAILKKQKSQDIASENHEIVKIFTSGDKLDQNKLENLKAFLPTPDTNSNNTEAETLIALDDSIRGFYLLGDRTPISEIPTQGTAKYTGTWHGRIGNHWQSEAGKGEYASKSNFDVNFADKKLTGTLTETKGINPAFKITADIKDNGFVGKIDIARDTGIDLDPNRLQNKEILTSIKDSKVQGGFYGENAKHLAGTFAFDGNLADSDDKLKNQGKDTVVGGGVFYGTNEKIKND